MSLTNNEKQEEIVEYKSIILGAVANFGSIDPIDLHVLVSEFTRVTGIKVEGNYYDFDGYQDIIEYKKDGTITLKEGFNLSSLLEIDHHIVRLRERLLKKVDPRVKEFIDNCDENVLQKLREDLLRRERVVNKANVLLISDNLEDYQGLINCGFKNIDYFKSIIRANSYFEKYPEKLKQYHLIIKGNQNVQNCCLHRDVPLDRELNKLVYNSPVLQILFTRKNSLHDGIHAFLSDRKIHRSWDVLEQTIEDFYERVIENILLNGILDEPCFNTELFTPHEDYINPNRFVPKTIEDLKILVLGYGSQVSKVANDLGVNITFKEDNNSSLGLYVKSNLGDYDIIITSDIYSGNILNMNEESTEQCKDTGRELTLLMTFENEWRTSEELGSVIKIKYVYGGNLAPESNVTEKEMTVLRQSSPEFENRYVAGNYFDLKAMLESAVSLYNEALKRQGRLNVEGTNFRTIEEINEEFNAAYNAEEARKQKEMEPIIAFDSLRYQIFKYLGYKKRGQTKKVSNDINIIEGRHGITVENIINGRVACTITFKKIYNEDGLRVFTVQTRTKKGTLSSPEIVGLYTSLYDGKENVPNKPNPAQLNALSSIEKKINYAVKPINDEVWNQICEEEKKNIRKLINPETN